MTALENVLVAQHSHTKAGVFRSILRTAGRRSARRSEVREKAREELAYVGPRRSRCSTRSRSTSPTATSAGSRSRARSRRTRRLLLLDEPTAGMNPQESRGSPSFMQRLRDERGLTILLIEHDMKVVMGVSERITVLDHGEKIAEGDCRRRCAKNERVVEAYLGKQG